jgi:hypothetical protein
MKDEATVKDEPGTALALPKETELFALFSAPEGLEAVLSRIETEVRSHAPDLSTKKGRDAIASLAMKVAKSKVALDNAGKALNEEARAKINAVDEERRKVRARLDALRDEARAPLTEWEAKEEARVAALEARVAALSASPPAGAGSADIRAAIKKLEATQIDETWGDFLSRATYARNSALESLRERLVATEKAEADAAELARLRAEAAERAAKEAEERAAREVAERQAQYEKNVREAAERAEKAVQARAEREKAEAEERHKRELAEAAAREERARAEERARIEAEQKRAADEKARREADEANRAAAFEAIHKAIMTLNHREIAKAILDGKVPHVRVEI